MDGSVTKQGHVFCAKLDSLEVRILDYKHLIYKLK